MLQTPIFGFAAPYGQRNCYGELFTPRVYRGKLRPMPIKFDHERDLYIGEWDDVWEDPRGIWVRGMLNLPDELGAKLALFHKEIPELSVCWCGSDSSKHFHSREWRAAHNNAPIDVLPEDTTGLAECSLVDRGAFKGTWWKYGDEARAAFDAYPDPV